MLGLGTWGRKLGRVFATDGKGHSEVAGDVVDFMEEDSSVGITIQWRMMFSIGGLRNCVM